jgi:hypothetical protein
MSAGMHVAWDFAEEPILGINSHSGLLLSALATGKPAFLTAGSFVPKVNFSIRKRCGI